MSFGNEDFMKEIAIISKDKNLSRLIELEAASLSVAAKSFAALPMDLLRYSCVFVDIDGVELTDEHTHTVAVTRLLTEDVSRRFGRVLVYPFELTRLRSYISSASTGDDGFCRNERDIPAEDIIYISRDGSAISVGGEKHRISEYERRVLSLLCENSGKCVSRERLSEALGADSGNIADVYICRLRKKLETGIDRRVIHTVRGDGYMTRFLLEYDE